jgi:DNA-binding Xre family transcriptional regulator
MIVNQAKEIVDRAIPEGETVNIKALAQKLGVAYNTAYDLYHGRGNRIDYKTLDKFCELFNVEPGDVLIRQPNL